MIQPNDFLLLTIEITENQRDMTTEGTADNCDLNNRTEISKRFLFAFHMHLRKQQSNQQQKEGIYEYKTGN